MIDTIQKMVKVRVLRTDDCGLQNCYVDQIGSCQKSYGDYLVRKGMVEIYDGEDDSTVTLCEGAEITANQKQRKESRDKEENKQSFQSLCVDIYHLRLYEQIYDTKKKISRFACYDSVTDKVEYKDAIEYEGKIIAPIIDNEVKTCNIKLPSQAVEYGDESKLIEEIQSFIYKYVDLPDDFRYYCALNILKSWVYERFHTINYLRFQGEPGCGKSRALDVIGYLHYKPIATSGTVTAAPIYRLITKWAGTLIIDEADRKQSDETDEIIKIINQGYEKGRSVLRCNPENKTQVEFFDTYCPKVLATRHKFDDPATETRCMTQIMTGTDRKDIISSIDDNFWNEMQVLRNKLLLWRFRNYFNINPVVGENLDWGTVEPRLKQVNVGFAALIYNNPTALQQFMNHVHNKQNEINADRSETYEGQIVEAMSRLIIEDKPFIAKDIIAYADLQDRMGRLWKPRLLSSYMKTLGFPASKLKRIENEVCKIYYYDPEMILRLLRKYLMPDQYENFIKIVSERALSKQKSLKTESYNHDMLYALLTKNVNDVTVVTNIYGYGKTVTQLKDLSAEANCNRSGGHPLQRLQRLPWLQRLHFMANELGALPDGTVVHFEAAKVECDLGHETVELLLQKGTLKNIKSGYYSIDKSLLDTHTFSEG